MLMTNSGQNGSQELFLSGNSHFTFHSYVVVSKYLSLNIVYCDMMLNSIGNTLTKAYGFTSQYCFLYTHCFKNTLVLEVMSNTMVKSS